MVKNKTKSKIRIVHDYYGQFKVQVKRFFWWSQVANYDNYNEAHKHFIFLIRATESCGKVSTDMVALEYKK